MATNETVNLYVQCELKKSPMRFLIFPQTVGNFLELTGEKIVKLGQHLAKIRSKYDSLRFWATLYM